MIDPDLLKILACPDSHQPLRAATEAELAAVNARIAAGSCRNVGGQAVAEPLEEALVREDGRILYPIRESIPVLLVDEGLALD